MASESMRDLDLQVNPDYRGVLEKPFSPTWGAELAAQLAKEQLATTPIEMYNSGKEQVQVPDSMNRLPIWEGLSPEDWNMNEYINRLNNNSLREPTEEERNNIKTRGTPVSNLMPPMGNLNKWLMLNRMTG